MIINERKENGMPFRRQLRRPLEARAEHYDFHIRKIEGAKITPVSFRTKNENKNKGL